MTDSGQKKKKITGKRSAAPAEPVRQRKRNVHSAGVGKENAPSALMSKLWEQAAVNNDSLPELAEKLDMSYPYLMALARGERPTDKVERKHLVMCAKYLNVPVGQVYLLSGALLPEDFIFEPTKEENIQHVLKAMRNDPLWTAHVPSEKVLKHADPSLKLLICLLYERAARTSFFEGTEASVYSG